MDQSPATAALTAAALDLAEASLFEDVSLRAICDHAGVSLADCAAAEITREALLALIDAEADRQMLEGAGQAGLDSQPAKDRLFDVIMARFDALEARRAAWTSILLSERTDIAARAARIARRGRTARWVLEASGLSSEGFKGLGKIAGLARVLRLSESAWLEDGPDLARTMATLDRELQAGASLLKRVRGLATRASNAMRSPAASGREGSARQSDGAEPGQTGHPLH
jgi:hypothetical protein